MAAGVPIMSEISERITDELTIYRRPESEVWQARHKTESGWKRFSTGETDKGKARVAATLKVGGIDALKSVGKSPDAPTFSQVSNLYLQSLDDLKKKGLEKPSHANYRLYVRKWLDPFFGKKRIDAIDHDTINEWEIWRVEQRAGKPLSKSSVNGINIAFREILKIARRKKWVTMDQMPDLENNGTKGESRAWFKPDEMTALLEFMDGGWIDAEPEPMEIERNGKTFTQSKVHTQRTKDMRKLLRWYILILWESGMRPGEELDKVKWRDVDLDFVADDNVNYPRVLITGGKMGSQGKKRTIVCMPSSIEHFQEIQKFTGFKKGRDENEFVFRLPDGTTPHRFSDIFADLLIACFKKQEDAHGNVRTLYSIRHTFITERLLANVSPALVAAQCGTSLRMINDWYSKLTADMNAPDLMKLKPDRMASLLYGGFTVPLPPGMTAPDVLPGLANSKLFSSVTYGKKR